MDSIGDWVPGNVVIMDVGRWKALHSTAFCNPSRNQLDGIECQVRSTPYVYLLSNHRSLVVTQQELRGRITRSLSPPKVPRNEAPSRQE